MGDQLALLEGDHGNWRAMSGGGGEVVRILRSLTMGIRKILL